MRVSDTLAFAAGHWRIERVLDDHRSGTQGRFAGRAALTEPCLPGAAIPGTGPAPGTALQYLETGELRFGTHTGPATRALRYQGLPGGAVDVRFTDGHLFYRLDLRSGRCAAVHHCGADRYEITYLVLGEDVMEEHWRVHGPDKDYDATATLTRRDN
ncbi:MAG: DUF6314 family protein [Streptosporangiaceae bacterium]